MCRWRSTASAALADEVNATSPVDARRLAASVVLRHPPHADQRVRPAPQHQLLQVADPLQVPVLRRLEDPLPQPPYVVLDRAPVDRVPVQVRRPRGPFTSIGVQLARKCWRRHRRLSKGSPGPRQHPSGSAQTRGIRPVIRPRRRRRRHYWVRFPAAFRPPAFASWAILFPPRRSAFLTVGPPGPNDPDQDGVSTFHMRKTRPGRVPPRSRGGGVHATGQMPPVAACRFAAASPAPRSSIHPPEAHLDETISAVHSRSPVRPSPRLRPRMDHGSLRLLP